MDITTVYSEFFEVIKPCLIVSGLLSLTLNLIIMLINMIISSATGQGLRIGMK